MTFENPLLDMHGKYDSRWLDTFGGYSNEQWLEVLLKSIEQRVIEGIEFPSFPSKSFQEGSVGASNENTLHEASVFYDYIYEFLKKEGHTDIRDFKVMDFGACWGRYLRFFLKDVRNDNLYGIDAVESFLKESKQSGIPCNLYVVPNMGPSPFPDDYFSLTYGYSVFSHLSEKCATSWFNELHRVMKPGGMFIGTTESRRFIGFCKDLSDNPDKQLSTWHTGLAQAGKDAKALYRIYDEGGFPYMSTGGGASLASDVYGEAVIPEAYLKNVWGDKFELLDFEDNPDRFWQTAFVLKKK